MQLKVFFIVCALAVAHAGFIPAAYHAPVVVGHAPLAVATPAVHLATPTVHLAAPAVRLETPALASHSSNVLRGPGGATHVSESHSAIDTAFSSDRRSDVRIGGHGLLGVAYSAAPQVSHVVFDSGIEHYVF